MGTYTEWTFTVLDLAKLTNLPPNALHQAIHRGKVDPGSLESLFLYLSRHAKPALRRKMIAHALYEDSFPKKGTKEANPAYPKRRGVTDEE